MAVYLFVHNSFWELVDIRPGLPYLLIPTYEPRMGTIFHAARFLPVPGTAETIWECTDPDFALRDGKLTYVGEGA